jgi:polysaccharide pyruvyl transferase WcaK-like protein
MAKILICGVPYGCDNVGDEAILASIVAHLRRMKDGLEIGVVTVKPEETAKKLNVKGIPLLFDPHSGRPLWTDEIRQACEWAHVYIHGGATGIHDYPMHMLEGLRIARECGCKTVVCGTGGGPYNHKFYEGRKTKLLGIASKATIGLVNFRKIAEGIVTKKYRRTILEGLNAVDLLLVRDAETRRTLINYGMDGGKIHVSGDSVFALEPAASNAADKIAADANLWNDDKPIVGVCISSQKQVVDMNAVVRMCDAIIEKYGAHVLFVPMNPHTDDKVGDDIAAKMKRGGVTKMIRGYKEPEDLLAFLSRLHVIISSRLHLIIMGAVAGVPSVGIGRGSGKITNFLGRFGLQAAGEYLDVNYDLLSRRFDDVWNRRDELSGVINVGMKKAKDLFKESMRLMIPILESVKGG